MSNIRSRISRNDIAAERAEAIQVRLSAGHGPFLVPYSTFCPLLTFPMHYSHFISPYP